MSGSPSRLYTIANSDQRMWHVNVTTAELDGSFHSLCCTTHLRVTKNRRILVEFFLAQLLIAALKTDAPVVTNKASLIA